MMCTYQGNVFLLHTNGFIKIYGMHKNKVLITIYNMVNLNAMHCGLKCTD